MRRVLYSCVLLDEPSRILLLNKLQGVYPKNWKLFAHHMTINLGEICDEAINSLGKEVQLKVTKIGVSDLAIAVGVEGFFTKNDKPHITIAINTEMGGKPKNSNDITEWVDIDHKFMISGEVCEIEAS